MSVRRERSSVTFIFLSCARERVSCSAVVSFWCGSTVEMRETFLAASCLPPSIQNDSFLFTYSFFSRWYSIKGFLALLYQEQICCCIPAVYFSVEIPSHFIIFLFDTFWKLNKMRKILAPVSNLYVFNLKFYIFTSIIVLFYIDIIQNCTMPYIQNIKSIWKQRNVQTWDWLTIFFWLATYIPDTYYFTWNKVLQ